ncbi:MAG: alpha/beta fold hydrolase [Planctomycetota bacterium]
MQKTLSVLLCGVILASVAKADEQVGKSDMSIPMLEPKPLIWISDGANKESEQTESESNAKRLLGFGNRLKAMEDFEKAESAYLAAVRYNPKLAYAHYQLACNYELWGKHDLAVEQFERAIEVGFSDFPTALSDGELGKIRELVSFKTQLSVIRERYIESASTRIGQPIAVPAKGAKPKSGWPVMILLHGYGDTNLSYLGNAAEWAELGFVSIALPGSVPSSAGRFMWSLDSIDPTYRDIQAVLDSPLLSGIDSRRVYLLGFSQGALHGLLLAKEYPTEFAGIVALSPGGSLADDLFEGDLPNANPAPAVFFIHGDQEPHASLVRLWSGFSRKAGWRFTSMTHPGGHHFPETWDEDRNKVSSFLNQ